MSSAKKAARELQNAVEDHRLQVISHSSWCEVFNEKGNKVAGYTMSNGDHSVLGAIRDLRKRGLLPADEQVGTEKPRRTQPADARKARARKKSPAPVTRLPRDVERVPADRLAVKDGVRFGVYGPTRVADALSRVRTAGGQDIDPQETARAAARLAAADRRAARVAVVADTPDPVVAVEDDGPDLAPEAVAAESSSLCQADRPAVPARTFHELLPVTMILERLLDGLGSSREIAALCGMPHSSFSYVLSGRVRVTPRAAMKFEVGLGVEGLAERLLIAQMRDDLREMRYLAKAGEL